MHTLIVKLTGDQTLKQDSKASSSEVFRGHTFYHVRLNTYNKARSCALAL